jgi:hypothetical protein
MKKELTVRQVIKIGVILVNTCAILMPVIIVVGCALILIIHEEPPALVIGTGLILNMTIGFVLLHKVMIKWRMWAFTRVQNVYELKRRLEMYPVYSLLNNDKFYNTLKYGISREYKEIYKKFSEPEVFVDDKTIPSETFIYYSKREIYISLAFSVFLLSLGILSLFANDYNLMIFTFVSLLAGLIGFFDFYRRYKKIKNRTVKLIINNIGIKIDNANLHKWEDIEDIKFNGDKYTKYVEYRYAKSNNKKKMEYLNYKDLGIDTKNLSELIYYYQMRNKHALRTGIEK